jgi:hypothetical protein
MSVSRQTFSHHILDDNKYIDVQSLIRTLNALRVLEYHDNYDIVNTRCKDYQLKEEVINYYKKEGVCTEPIVVTDDDFCLDGRHRVAYRKQINDTTCSAYIVPGEYVSKFVKIQPGI